jgi:hypothetical protein
MSQFWIALGVAIAVMAVTAPLAAMVLVSIASRREESASSLSRQAPGPVTAAARRLLAYRSDHVASLPPRLRTRARVASAAVERPRQAPHPIGEPDLEVRFAYARRSLPDPGQFPARRQPQPRSVGAHQRETAGV